MLWSDKVKYRRHGFILFVEKFIDKYNDFIQYFNTHMTSFWQYALSVCRHACLSVCLPVRQCVWVHRNSARICLITLLVAQWVGMTVNHFHGRVCMTCSMALVWNMASIPSESVKRSLLSSSALLPHRRLVLLLLPAPPLSLPHSERLVAPGRHFQQTDSTMKLSSVAETRSARCGLHEMKLCLHNDFLIFRQN